MKWTDPLFPNLKKRELAGSCGHGTAKPDPIHSYLTFFEWNSSHGCPAAKAHLYLGYSSLFWQWDHLFSLDEFGFTLFWTFIESIIRRDVFICWSQKAFIIIVIMIYASLMSHTSSTTCWWQEVTHFQVRVQPDKHVRTWSKLPEDLTDVACRCSATFVPHFKILPNGGHLILPAVYVPFPSDQLMAQLTATLAWMAHPPLILPTPQGPSLPLNRPHGALQTWRAVVNCTLVF